MPYQPIGTIYEAAKAEGDKFKRDRRVDLDPHNPHWRIFRLCHTQSNTSQKNCLILPTGTGSAVTYLIEQIDGLNTAAVPLWVKFSALATLFSTMLRWLHETPDQGRHPRERTLWRAANHGDFDREVACTVDDGDFQLIVGATERLIRCIVDSETAQQSLDLSVTTYRWLKEHRPPEAFAPPNTSIETAFFEGRLVVVLAACVCRIARERQRLLDDAGGEPTNVDLLFADMGRYYRQLRRAVAAREFDTYLHIESLYLGTDGAHFLHCPWRQHEMHREIAGLGGMVVRLARRLLPRSPFQPTSVRWFAALSLRHRERQLNYANRRNDGIVAWRLAAEAVIDSLEYSGRTIASAALAAHYLAACNASNPAAGGRTTQPPEWVLRRYKAQALNCGYMVREKQVPAVANPPPHWNAAWLTQLRDKEAQPKAWRKAVNRVAEYAQLYVSNAECPVPPWRAEFEALFAASTFADTCTVLLHGQAVQLLVNLVRIVVASSGDFFEGARQYIVSAGFLCQYCALLNEAFDLPFHADRELRTIWQNTVLSIVASLDLNALQGLPADALLRLHAIAAHAGNTALRGLEWHEREMLAAVQGTGRGANASNVARQRKVTAASEAEAIETLTLYANRRTYGQASAVAYVQVILLSGSLVQVFACGVVNNKLTTSLHRVAFNKDDHGEHSDSATWLDALEKFDPIAGVMCCKPGDTVVGEHPSFIALKAAMIKAAKHVAGDNVIDLLLSPDPTFATIPWQYFFVDHDTAQAAHHPYLVCHVPSIKWLHHALTEHQRALQRGWVPRYHQRGVSGWMPTRPTPSPELELRPQVAEHFGADKHDLHRPKAHGSTPGLSIGYVFAHGNRAGDGEGGGITTEAMNTDPTKAQAEWHALADHRIVLLLSCHTAHGMQGNLRDFVSLPTLLLSRAKAVIAPPYAVPSDVALALAEQVGTDLMETLKEQQTLSIPLGSTYKKALENDWRVSLFSMWGLASEFIRWLPATERPNSN